MLSVFALCITMFVVDATVLDKYGVSLNSAILAEEKHLPMYDSCF